MKRNDKFNDGIDPARVALSLGLSVGLGIVVHEGFFLVAGAIAAGALTVATVHAVQKHSGGPQLRHQYR